ncbi:MAG: hypothetical protein ACLFUO_03645 [Candidatus Woesearchaeota archaeon]
MADPLEKSYELQKKAKEYQEYIRAESDKEYLKTLEIARKSQDVESVKNRLFFEHFCQLEKEFVGQVRLIQEAAREMANTLSIDEFKKIISQIVLALGDIEEFRQGIKQHIDVFLNENREIMECIDKKMKTEKLELKTKEEESALRNYMWSSKNINKYLKYLTKENVLDTGDIETQRAKQIKSLNDQKNDLMKLQGDAEKEYSVVRLIMDEFKQIQKSNSYEGVLITELSNIIGVNKLLDITELPTPAIVEDLSRKLGELRKVVSTDVELLTIIPNQIIDLKKEELLDKEDLDFLYSLEQISDLSEMNLHK